MLRYVVAFCLCTLALPAWACPAPPVAELEIHLAAVNDERRRAGRAPLALSPELGRVAQAHACDMAQRGYFSHTSQDGRSVSDRINRAGLPRLCTMGENIARGQRDVPSVMAGWMRSSGHRRNILDRDFTLVGFGRADGPNWVQLFARPC
ncbi:MAG: CAP domain-containing protein [Roseinatronobacter sp.]|nr:MAG: CAP domain-containing protein [Roseinatronobacter sp.]